MSGQPWTFDQARANCASATRAQEQAEETMREVAKDYAIKEEAYRKALAAKIVELHAEGTAWSACADVARGDSNVARLRRERDIAEGVREAMTHALWRHNANRRDAQRFSDWSQRREFAEAYGQTPEPQYDAPHGGRS